jgi:hypothetical protein
MHVSRPAVIDADGHIYERDRDLALHFEGRYRTLKRLETFPLFPTLDGWPRALLSPESAPTIDPAGWLSFMAEAGLARAVLYPTAGLAVGLIQKPEWAIALCRAYNNWLYHTYLTANQAFHGVALLPVHDPTAAAEELHHAVREQGMVAGLLPANNVLRKSYGHRDFDPLYAAAQQLDVPLVVHGAPSQGLGIDHFDTFIKVHALEHPLAILIQCTSIVLDGVFERFPQVRIGFLEAGCGWVPYLMDRLDYEYEAAWAREASAIVQRPSTYMTRGQMYVTCELEEACLPYVISRFGAEHLMYPSDFPHERARSDFLHDVPEFLQRDDIPDAAKPLILGDNARRFYRLPDD